MVVSVHKILRAFDRRGSQLSDALRFKSISHFPTSISSIEILPFRKIETFFQPEEIFCGFNCVRREAELAFCCKQTEAR